MKINKACGILACMALSGCGGSSSDTGGGETTSNSTTELSSTSSSQSTNELITQKCEILKIEMQPASGILSKATSALRAIIDFEISPGINVTVRSDIYSVDGNDRILSDRTEFTSDIQVNKGMGQALLSYNLNTPPPRYNGQFTYADPDKYNKVVVRLSQQGVSGEGSFCSTSKEVDLILTP